MIISTTKKDVALAQYFRSIFDPDDVLEANVALDLFGLESKVAQRDTLLKNLEVSGCALVYQLYITL